MTPAWPWPAWPCRCSGWDHAFCLGAALAPVQMRLVRSGAIEVMNMQFIETARAKGLAEPAVVVKHAFRNACIPVIAVAGPCYPAGESAFRRDFAMTPSARAARDDDVGGDGLNRVAAFLLTRTPLGTLVGWVARVPASVHIKLLVAFLVITGLFITMAGVSLQTISRTAEQSRKMHAAHERVEWSQQIDHTLARQMHFTALALLVRDEAAVARILRENNRFNDALARLEAAGTVEERELIQQIRARQDGVMETVADIANAIRDGRLDEATARLLGRQERAYQEIEALVGRLVQVENRQMLSLKQAVEEANFRSIVLTACFAALAILLALLCGFIISWSCILPLRKAQDFLGAVGAGDFGARITVQNRDEFGAQAASMNRMSAELRRLADEQQAAAAELRQLNAELERTSRAKSEFLANMSHELRTPMNAILGFTEMLRDGLYGEVPRELEEPLADIQTNGRHLLGLINDVLDLSKIEAGRMDLMLEEYAVPDVVESVRGSLRSLAVERGLEFSTRVPAEVPVAYGDAKRIRQCLLNLAGNALKFTAQGRVEIGVEHRGDELVYRVTDTGIGIPKEELERVFDEFRQVDAAVTRAAGGTGLGLSITKKFIELHGGRIWVESEPGAGSTFWFTVPVRVAVGA
ncbi:MAG TPA: ATP-binding protein [Methylomirabilota bacterium]|nr:ATP-binding protein [Methylomirabilota bacterium]